MDVVFQITKPYLLDSGIDTSFSGLRARVRRIQHFSNPDPDLSPGLPDGLYTTKWCTKALWFQT
jgi:hypothetical protein